MKYLHIELPSLHLVWKRAGQEDVVCSVIRTNYPKPSALQVAAIMRAAGADVRVLDMKIRQQDNLVPYREFTYEGGVMVASRMGMPFEDARELIEWADVIGLSINSTSWANIATDFISYAKRIHPRVRVWVGGTDATFRPEYYLQHGADLVVLGEGENIVRTLASGGVDIPGVATVKASLVFGLHIQRGCDLDALPLQAVDLFAEDIPLWNMNIEANIPLEIQTPIGFLFVTRGCNQSCDFCTTPQKYGRLRFRSLESIRAELEMFLSYRIGTINIWDDSLSSLIKLGRRDHLISIVRLLREMGFAYEFSQGMVISDLWDAKTNQPDEQLIHELFRHELRDGRWVGCYGEYFPMEFLQVDDPHSASSKLMSYEKELVVMRAVLSQGIKWLTYSCIIGRPQDGSLEFGLATKRLNEVTGIIESYGAQGLPTPFMYSVFPGTRLWNNKAVLLKYGIDEYPELYQLNATPHGTDCFSPGELMEAKMKLEKSILSPEQCREWWRTGRYQWKQSLG
jgi:hypothetical protein